MAKKREKRECKAVVLEPDAARIDIGAEEIYVAVPPDRDEESVRMFSSFTCDLHALADWLQQCRIRTVAMESTGVYWIPLFQILEARGLEVYLVNAHYLKSVPGRKSDVSGLSVDSVFALRRIAASQLPPSYGHLCRAFPMEASRKSVADGLRAHPAYAEVTQPDEPADPPRTERPHRGQWASDFGCDPSR